MKLWSGLVSKSLLLVVIGTRWTYEEEALLLFSVNIMHNATLFLKNKKWPGPFILQETLEVRVLGVIGITTNTLKIYIWALLLFHNAQCKSLSHHINHLLLYVQDSETYKDILGELLKTSAFSGVSFSLLECDSFLLTLACSKYPDPYL